MGKLQLLRENAEKIAAFDVFQRWMQERRLGKMAPSFVQRLREMQDSTLKQQMDFSKLQGQAGMWKNLAIGAGVSGLLLWLLRDKLNPRRQADVTINRYGA